MSADMAITETPGSIAAPPSGAFPLPPAEPLVMTLPFGALSWENFERLCYRLILREGAFDHVARYGRQGQAQEGIDVFARKPDGRYVVWQAKRYATYTAANLRSAVEAFLSGKWVARTDTFVIAVQATLDDTSLQDEIERQAAALVGKSIRLEVLGGDALVERLRPHQDLVLSFFGRGWLTALYGPDAEPGLADRLDGVEFAKVRAQLARVYAARFSDLDHGMAGARFTGSTGLQHPLPLLERFAMTDVFVRERTAGAVQGQKPARALDVAARDLRPKEGGDVQREGGLEEVRRLSAADWLSDGDQLAIIADAGAGKSTLLRAIALDLLADQTRFPALGQRWGDQLPIVLPFAKWARATRIADGEVGLKAVVAQTLQPLLTADIVSLVNRAVDERRIVLIIDGLDEWSAEQAARTALHTLLTYVQVHDIPTLVSGRPHGLRKIGALPQAWKVAELAPLSTAQQSHLAHAWFRHLQLPDPGGHAVRESVAGWRADRFLRELKAETALGELAGTPLLFIGLLFLSLRNVALPRNRTQALQALVTLLLETHPEARATAAGEGRARFENAATPEVRISAVGALAFASRRDGGDAGYGRPEARRAIEDHLAGSGYDAARAQAIAAELLAVNAETVGLLVEKGPDDIGFTHASLEEFLGALHVQSWPFGGLVAFASANAGNPRWRNVLRNLVGVNVRPNEIDDIVAALESAELDVAGDLNRRQLLAEIAFSPSAMSARTALRLATLAFQMIEGPGAMSERTAMVRLSLNGLSDPILQTAVEARLRRWTPRRIEHTSQLYAAIGSWPRDEEQLSALLAGLGGEDRYGARTCARVLAVVYAGDDDVAARLCALVSPNVELKVAAAAIEALVRGWPQSDLRALIAGAAASRSPLLQSMAIWAQVTLGTQTDDDRTLCLGLVSDGSTLDYFDRDIPKEALLAGWPDDTVVVEAALAAMDRGGVRGEMDRDVAMAAVLGSEPGRPAVKDWLLKELATAYPLNTMGGGSWAQLVRFAVDDADVRESVVSQILAGKQAYREYEIWPVVAELGDARLRDYAIAQVRSDEGNGRYWSLLPLLSGWSEDPRVVELVRDMIALDDADLGMVVSLLPELYDNAAQARGRLIRVLRNDPKARGDLVVITLAELGCDGADDEAVQAILPWLDRPGGVYEPLAAYHRFATHPAIRAKAVLRLERPDPPLHLIARTLVDDPAVREVALAAVSPLPRGLRGAIASAAGMSGDRHPALYAVLADYDHESDFQVRLQLSVDYHRLRLARGDTAGLVEHLSAELDRPGQDFEERRAAAFAGLVVLDAPRAVLTTVHRPGKVSLLSYRSRGLSAALGSLLIEKWTMLKSALGPDFADTVFAGDHPAWGDLSRFAGPNPEARREFLDWCGSTTSLGLTALAALADYWPRSGVLLDHVLRVLRSQGHRNAQTLPLTILSAEILRNQFLTTEHVAELSALFDDTREVHAAIALAIVAPDAPGLHQPRVPTLEIGAEHGNWLAAAQMASRLDPPDVFVAVVHAMAERTLYPGWQSQPQITDALVDRVIADEQARFDLRSSMATGLSPDAFVATATILTRAGYLDREILDMCAARLTAEQSRTGVPLAVFDINQDALRPYTHILIDFFQPAAS